MQTKNLISIQQFCISHNVEISFISSLKETGLIEIKTVKDTEFIDAGQLQQLEKFIRFYYELDINLEGIETVLHLLNRIKSMQDEIAALRNRLRLYETNE